MAIRVGLLSEVVAMAFDTVRTNKMRSGLTVLGVVIGITSIVGMTSLIRGFDESLRDSIRGDRARTSSSIQRFGPLELRQRRRVRRAPAAAEPDGVRRARHRGAGADTIQLVDVQLGVGGGPPDAGAGLLSRPAGRGRIVVFGTTENFADGHAAAARGRALLHGHGGPASAATSSCSARRRIKALFEPSGTDPIGKVVRVGAERYTVVGVFDKRPASAASTPARTTSW